MAIEPLSSIMSMQAQTAAPKVTAASTEKISADAANAAQAAEMVDNTTKAIENVQGKDGQRQGTDQRQETADPERLKKAVEQLNKKMSNSEAIYGIHEETNRVTIKIVDKDTKEVIRELPPEKTLDMIAKAWELAGILVDERR
ncbi:MAG: flagellar protein FlaG [Roseburia sp.]|nr:flagellar protein FlaG [Roseburia sp.]